MLKRIRIGIVFMLISALLSATGQLMWKIGKDNFIFIFIGLAFYGLGAIFMIKSLKLEKLSVAYPVMCISYLLALFYGYVFLNEVITIKKLVAVLLIIIGVSFCSRGK
ncbi:Uncharacterized membrane protein [Clostridium cavendishii DSM 21758]|uniref:Uncharacterized membrane protein n=1 Tax=Clostridium cavendishii DSM 21758 TaxID=1121302 RepID=A0A1M6UNF3_9CLOT|nr:EamA family transporter [Clostridium cavendishii]SHK70706.1 Uncharacterized membrane protein [Clostridium cavendishii DSM 21758]